MKDKNDTSKKDWWDELSNEDMELIQKGVEDAKNGCFISSEDYWKKLKKEN